MNDLGDSQIKRRDRDSQPILADVVYHILGYHLGGLCKANRDTGATNTNPYASFHLHTDCYSSYYPHKYAHACLHNHNDYQAYIYTYLDKNSRGK